MQINEKSAKKIILALLAVIVILLFFTCRGCKRDPRAPVIIPPTVIAGQVKDTEAVYKEKFDSLNVAFTDQRDSNAITLQDLHSLQGRAQQLAAELRRKAKPGIQQPAPIAGQLQEDTGMAPAASINGTIEEFISNSDARDTACNKAISNLQGQVTNREVLISAKDSLYSRLRSSFDLSLSQQEALLKYNKQLQRQIKRKKFGNTFWKITTAAAALFGVYQSLK